MKKRRKRKSRGKRRPSVACPGCGHYMRPARHVNLPAGCCSDECAAVRDAAARLEYDPIAAAYEHQRRHVQKALAFGMLYGKTPTSYSLVPPGRKPHGKQ